MTIASIQPLGSAYAAVADDTAESVVGSAPHQTALTALFDTLDAYGLRQGLPWCVGYQLRLVLPRITTDLSCCPDLLVHPTLGRGPRTHLPAATEGVPALVIEVANASTIHDRDLQTKRDIYAQVGIAEYLVFDPTREFLPSGLVAWTLAATGRYYQPWTTATNGRWHSTLGVSFQPEDHLLRVYDLVGQRLRTPKEQAEYLDHLNQQLAECDAQLATLNDELHAQSAQ